MKILTVDRVLEVLSYSAETGLFTWIAPPKQHPRMLNKEAGGVKTKGYIQIKIDGKKYAAHRLAWLVAHGEWPAFDIDHANGNPADNSIKNLRPATNPQNQANRKRNTGKVVAKGVRKIKSGRFQARISVEKRQIALGTFDSESEAVSAYMRAATKSYGEFARTH